MQGTNCCCTPHFAPLGQTVAALLWFKSVKLKKKRIDFLERLLPESSLVCFLQSKEEVMAVRLREADNIAAMAELQQQISELEIQVRF